MSRRPDSPKRLKSKILDGARGQEWLRIKARSLECGADFAFSELLA